MSDAWRYHVLASTADLARRWPAEARAAFVAEILRAPEAWRPTGDDDAERVAGARALARAWIERWRLERTAPGRVPIGPPPVRPPPTGEPESLGPLDDATADELAILWRFLGRELALRALRR